MYYSKITSIWGPMVAGINDEGFLEGLWFEGQKYFPVIATDAKWIEKNSICSETVQATRDMLANQIDLYQTGKLREFDLPLSAQGTSFQSIVWKILEKIPFGETTTYGQISLWVAREMGRESMSAQAVGGAIGHNPISIIIPCHRVIGKDSSLTGYAGGLDKKKGLILHEQSVR